MMVEMSDAMRFTPAKITVKRDEIVWQFSRAGEFNYACLLPSHFEAGMVGKIIVKSYV